MLFRPFRELFSIPLRNGVTKPKAVRGSGIKMVNMGELFANPRLINVDMDRVPLNEAERKSSMLAPDDLLFARQSLVLSGAGKCSIFVRDNEDVCFESHAIRCRLNKELADPHFYFYFFGSAAGRRLIETIVEQGAGASGIRGSDLAELSVPWIDPSVQRCIAQYLRQMDDKIAVNLRLNQTLEAMVQAIFKSWFVDFDPVKAKIAAKAECRDPLRAAMTAISGKSDAELDALPTEHFTSLAATAALFPHEMGEAELGRIPKGWHESTLGEQAAYLNRGISPKYIAEGGVLVLNQKCIRDFTVDPSKGRRHDPSQRNVGGRELQVGDVLVNSTGVGTLGRVAQMLQLDETTIVDSHVTVVRSGGNLNGAYLGQWFVTKQPEIEAMGEGSTGQTELSRAKLASMLMLVPDLAVVEAFAAAVSPLQTLIAVRGRESLLLQEARDALLPRLLFGDLRPSVTLQGAEA